MIKPTRTLVTGAAGMLGMDLICALSKAGQAFTALSHHRLDITDPDAVTAAVAGHDVVINAAAWTDVDGAEANEEAATAVNGEGVANLARACAASGAVLLHVSTDAVFAGERALQQATSFGDWRLADPYSEDDAPCPINAYGRSKLAGEWKVLHLLPERGYIVRTAWLYGAHGRNFIRTILGIADTQSSAIVVEDDLDVARPGEQRIEVVADQWGQPTWSMAVAHRLLDLAGAALDRTAPPGIYHATSAGFTNWYELASAVFDLAGLDPARLVPTPLEHHPRAAPQSYYSVLGHAGWAKAGLAPMDHWCDMLAEAWKDIRP